VIQFRGIYRFSKILSECHIPVVSAEAGTQFLLDSDFHRNDVLVSS
jgi:hypothetical protein